MLRFSLSLSFFFPSFFHFCLIFLFLPFLDDLFVGLIVYFVGDSIQSLSLMTSHCCFCSPIEYFASQWANSIFSRTPSPIDSVSEQVVESFISSLSVIEKDRVLRWKQHMTRKKFLSRLLHDNVFLALSSSSCSRYRYSHILCFLS